MKGWNIFKFLILLILFFPAFMFAQEQITITTYYPSPYGSYKELRADQMAIGSTYRTSALADGNLLVSGKVGIGTAVPVTTLDVNGTVRATSWAQPPSGAGLELYYYSDGAAYAISYNRTSSAFTPFYLYGSRLALMQGNVGIGTASPGAKLDVAGNIKWGTAGAILNTDQGASVELRGTGVPYIDFSNDAFTDYDARIILQGNDVLTIDGANVGIGTASPTVKLEVAGQIKITGGSPGLNKVLTSDATGVGTWSTPLLQCTTVTCSAPYNSTCTATCPAGYTLTGGGFSSSGQAEPPWLRSYPSGNAWTCGVEEQSGTCYARCCRI